MRLTLALLFTTALFACGTTEENVETGPAPKAVNTKCPMTSEDVSADVTTTYNGECVAFCCAGCITGWDKLSDAEKAEKLAKSK